MAQEKLMLSTMAKGAVQEAFEVSVEKILKNIGDPNTDSKKKRSINLKIDFVPQKGSEFVNILVSSKETLVPDNPIESMVVRKGTKCAEFEQTGLFDNEPTGENVINFEDRKENSK